MGVNPAELIFFAATFNTRKRYGESAKTPDLMTHGVNCYSASGLGGPWAYEGMVLTQASRVEHKRSRTLFGG